MATTVGTGFGHLGGVGSFGAPEYFSARPMFKEPGVQHRFADPGVERTEDIAMAKVSHGGQAALWLLQVADPEICRLGMNASDLQIKLSEAVTPGTSVVALNGIRHWLQNLRDVGLARQEKRGGAVLYTPIEDIRVAAAIGLYDRLREDYEGTGIVIPRVFGKPQKDTAGHNSQLMRFRFTRAVFDSLMAGNSDILLEAMQNDTGSKGMRPSYARDLLGRLVGAGLFEMDRSVQAKGAVHVEASDAQLDYMRELVGGLDSITLGAVGFTGRHARRAQHIASDAYRFTRLYNDFIPAGNERVNHRDELEKRVWAVLVDESNKGTQWTVSQLAEVVAGIIEAPDDSHDALKGRVNIHKTTVRQIVDHLVSIGVLQRTIIPGCKAHMFAL